MPHFDKWLTNVSPDAPVSRVARRAIGSRLQAVAHYLAAVSQRKKPAADDVHQLRIWTRRAAAALRLFSALAPKAHARSLKQSLRRLRRRAGRVRDCDVFLEQLEASSDAAPKIVQQLKRNRRAARKSLRKACVKLLKRSRFERDAERLLRDLEWPKRRSSPKPPAFADWCRHQLAGPSAEFFKLAGADFSDDQQLHALRIAGKRWRYALELAAVALPAKAHQRLYAALSDLQERLGDVCDRLAAVQRLTEWHAHAGKAKAKERRSLQQAIDVEERRLIAARRRFLRWWTPARRNRLQRLWETAVSRAESSS
jgi:CHAD domain-containing protein